MSARPVYSVNLGGGKRPVGGISFLPLIGDVFFNHCVAPVADAADKVAIRPEIRLPVILTQELWEFLLEHPGSNRLKVIDQFGRLDLWRCLEHDVDMIQVCINRRNGAFPVILKDAVGQFDQPVFELPGDHRMPVFCHYN